MTGPSRPHEASVDSTGIPIWVRVPGIITLVLVTVLVGAMLVGATGIAGSGRMGEMNNQNHGPFMHGRR